MTTLAKTSRAGDVPELCQGDRLTRGEFERRYDAMPALKKAELIEGVVYVGSAVSQVRHGEPHSRLVAWVTCYAGHLPGLVSGDNATVRLDLDNEVQPDAMLYLHPSHGGRIEFSREGYVEGAPELVAEVSASSVSYDLHDKLHAYRRNGVQEYVVWRVDDRAVDWFALRAGRYELLQPGADGLVRSEAFPGLWLDRAALLSGDAPRMLEILGVGLASPECSMFRARLTEAGDSPA